MRSGESLPGFLVRIGIAVAVLAVAVQTTAHLGNEFLLDDRVQGLDADVEGNAFTWASSVATFAVGLMAALHAAAFETRRREFSALAAITVWFSLDDVAIIHERAALELGEDVLGLPDYAAVRLWLVLYLPLLLVAGLLLWRIAQAAASPADRAVLLGLALLVASVPVEFIGVITRRINEEGALEAVRIAIEEGLELGGWILVAAGLTAIVCSALMRVAPPDGRQAALR
ncbi:MAG TPA: hypothetical protein VE615_00715 [Gaiellaceae bacterium]|jgi:hypothetical protein|nr:hypothetical protein [Gaiellaceae bacterium]